MAIHRNSEVYQGESLTQTAGYIIGQDRAYYFSRNTRFLPLTIEAQWEAFLFDCTGRKWQIDWNPVIGGVWVITEVW